MLTWTDGEAIHHWQENRLVLMISYLDVFKVLKPLNNSKKILTDRDFQNMEKLSTEEETEIIETIT